ncbi:MAG: DNA polymerase III subunit gamma/tau [Candidatus Levybacteria bacterium]|nr:DNA polymerase III subunit gamma/tau [Candidatus Levybacteria bacterium]
MVFYRKYRPQKISELDSKDIREKLYSGFSDLSSISHAFLFTGPKGLGKTSAARIVAKVVNCERLGNQRLTSRKEKKEDKKLNAKRYTLEADIEPCNECDQCVSITNGTNLDILEIDGASNRGIDEIRDLREKIRLAPMSANKKVYIIDEVHMLTTEAFNALLKTLEEPPGHVIFILCTTEPHKVPETILSRCSHIPFKLATKEELLSSFKRIKESEKLDIDSDVLEYISELSDGSFRDGSKIMEELASYSKSLEVRKITKEMVEEKYQTSNIKNQISKLLEYLEKKDTNEALKLASDLVEQGIDMKYFLEKLVGELHSMLLARAGVDLSLDPAGRRTNFEVLDLKELIELFTKAYGELKYAVLSQLPLELAVIEWAIRDGRLPHVADDARQSLSLNSNKSLSSLSESRLPKSENNSNVKSESAFSSFASGQSSITGSKSDHEKAPRTHDVIWQELISSVKTHNHSIAGILRGCSLKTFDEKELIIEAKYKFHKERLDDKKAMEVLEKVVEEITGKEVKIKVLLKEK